MYSKLFAHIRRFVPLTAADEVLIGKYVRFEKLKNKDFLLKTGQVCGSTYFVVEGCLRMYLETDSGMDQILQFAIDDWWMSDYSSFESLTPSAFSIQALGDTDVVILEKKNHDALLKTLPQIERYFRLILQRAYSATLMRIHFIYNFSGEERYRRFAGSFPDFVQRIPQYMLASYLGFTPEFISKIRGKKS